MKRVIIESPYAGAIKRNTRYARLCMLDSLRRGEAPLASHLLYPQMLDEDTLSERHLGINAGLAWMARAEIVAIYEDFGRSRGMLNALCEAQRLNIHWERRYLLDHPCVPWMSESDKEIELGIHWSSPIRRWFAAIWGEPSIAINSFFEPITAASARQEAKSHAEILAQENSSETINETLARNAPSPLPWGEPRRL